MNEKVETIPVLDHGFVSLLDVMGSDADIANAARVSYDTDGVYDSDKNKSLIDYLIRNKHTSPCEMAEMKFMICLPIFVARQLIRHRTANVNEISARYTTIDVSSENVYRPTNFRLKSTTNKQSFSTPIEDEEKNLEAKKFVDSSYDAFAISYDNLLDMGIAPEMARIVEPVGVYTRMIWKMDLHNLLHFLRLRLDEHAQYEIREYARAIAQLVSKHFPFTWDSYCDHVIGAVSFSQTERMMISFLDDNDTISRDDVPDYLFCMLSGTKASDLLRKLQNINNTAYNKLQGLLNE